MNTTARRALLSLAIASLSAAVPFASDAAVRAANACSMQHNDPIVLHRSVPNVSLETRASARTTIATVTLSRAGVVRHIAMAHSSGDARFDAAALRATERTAFAPAARSCVAVDSRFDYAFVASAGGGVRTAVRSGSIEVVASRH